MKTRQDKTGEGLVDVVEALAVTVKGVAQGAVEGGLGVDGRRAGRAPWARSGLEGVRGHEWSLSGNLLCTKRALEGVTQMYRYHSNSLHHRVSLLKFCDCHSKWKKNDSPSTPRKHVFLSLRPNKTILERNLPLVFHSLYLVTHAHHDVFGQVVFFV